MPKSNNLTRRQVLKAAGGGVVLLGAGTGCRQVAGVPVELPDDYLPEGGSRMNIVVIIIDSLRKDHVGALGNRWIETPNLDALAGESLVFERALPESIPTINARRAIHTGTRSWPRSSIGW